MLLLRLLTPLLGAFVAFSSLEAANAATCRSICSATEVYGFMLGGSSTCLCDSTGLSSCQCSQCYVRQANGSVQTFAYSSDGTCPWSGTDCSTCEKSSSSSSGSSTTTSTPTNRPLSPSPSSAPTTSAPSPSPTPTNAAAQASSSTSGQSWWKSSVFVSILVCGCAFMVGTVLLLTRNLYQRLKSASAVDEEHLSNGELHGAPMRTTAPYDHLGDSNQDYEVLVYSVDPLRQDRGPQNISSQTF